MKNEFSQQQYIVSTLCYCVKKHFNVACVLNGQPKHVMSVQTGTKCVFTPLSFMSVQFLGNIPYFSGLKSVILSSLARSSLCYAVTEHRPQGF